MGDFERATNPPPPGGEERPRPYPRAIRTSRVELDELRPCDFCGGPIAPVFRVIEVKPAAIAQGVRDYLGLRTMGHHHAVAAMFAGPAAEVLENEPTRLFCCNKCSTGPLDITAAAKTAAEAREKRKAGHVTHAAKD